MSAARRNCRRPLSGEQGSATVWLVALMAVVWTAATIAVHLGMARVARHRADNAADLSALSAAAWAFAAPRRSCEHARAIAIANGARMEGCAISGGIADVTVSVRFSLPLLGSRTAVGVARAGPVGAPT